MKIRGFGVRLSQYREPLHLSITEVSGSVWERGYPFQGLKRGTPVTRTSDVFRVTNVRP